MELFFYQSQNITFKYIVWLSQENMNDAISKLLFNSLQKYSLIFGTT